MATASSTSLPILLALTTGLTAAPQEPTSTSADFPKTIELEGLLEEWTPVFENVQLPGLSFVVVRDGEIVHLDTYGVRDDQGNPVTPDTGFYIASITKTYVAMAVQTLVQAGKVDLDDAVQKYLPRFALADANAAKTITVRDLLSHAPGINSGPAVFLDAYTGQITEDRYYHFLAMEQPRGRVAYSNTHFTLAGRVIESVSGEKWQDYLAKRILEPGGMLRTSAYASKLYSDPDAAFPMLPSADGPVLSPQRKNDSTMHAAGGMGTTAKDMARWLLLNLGMGTIDDALILDAGLAMEMQEPQSTLASPRDSMPDASLTGFGLGWMMGEFRGERIYAHGGGYTGASSYMIFLPDHDLGAGYLANTSGAGVAAAMEMMAEVLDRMIPLEPKERLSQAKRRSKRVSVRAASSADQPSAITADDLSLAPEQYLGSYSDEFWGTVVVAQRDGQLIGNIGAVKLDFGRSSKGKDHCRLLSSVSDPGDEGEFVIEEGRVKAFRATVFGVVTDFTRDG
ncbi:MAG: serine hydrolase domain-containing protein [Planctomycetota bacterium]|jgi:CubicO group peptidase (beta-lactamase class C family)